MELKEAIRNRRSIRQFMSKPVPEEMIRELIADSLWAPSWGNTQPWEIVRELFSIPENKTLVMGAILGWPDPAAAVNRFERQRGALDEFVKWVT